MILQIVIDCVYINIFLNIKSCPFVSFRIQSCNFLVLTRTLWDLRFRSSSPSFTLSFYLCISFSLLDNTTSLIHPIWEVIYTRVIDFLVRVAGSNFCSTTVYENSLYENNLVTMCTEIENWRKGYKLTTEVGPVSNARDAICYLMVHMITCISILFD